MHQPAHANSGIGGPGCTRLGAVRHARSEKGAGPVKHSHPAPVRRVRRAPVPGITLTARPAAAWVASSGSTAAAARKRAQSARAADKALCVRRRAVTAAAPCRVSSVSGQRLRPPDSAAPRTTAGAPVMAPSSRCAAQRRSRPAEPADVRGPDFGGASSRRCAARWHRARSPPEPAAMVRAARAGSAWEMLGGGLHSRVPAWCETGHVADAAEHEPAT